MPELENHLNKLGFTPDEVRLAVNIEQIIFVINRKVQIGMAQVGATIETVIEELNKDVDEGEDPQYYAELMNSTIQKCKENHILTEIDGKLYSITYYGKRMENQTQ